MFVAEVELEGGLELKGNLTVQHIHGEKGSSSLEVGVETGLRS
jgi:hypothetical protein